MNARLQCNFTILVVGSIGSGKSVFTSKILKYKNKIMSNPPQKIVWCYSVWQPFSETLKYLDIEFIEGVPSMNIIKSGNFILVVDDLMDSEQTAIVMNNIYTKYSHHYNITCIFILQNLFPKFKQARTISLNAHYIVLMKNTKDKAQVRHLASQVFPGNSRYLVDSFQDATITPFSHLLLDFKPESSEKIRLRTGIFPTDALTVYLKV